MSRPAPWKRNLYAIWAAEFLAIAGFSTSTPVVPFFLQDLGVHDPLQISFFVGLLAALPSLMLAIFAPIWGSIADSYGRKPMLLRAMFGGTVILFLQGLAQNPWQLLVLRTLQGCITGTVAAATVLVASNSPKEETGSSLGILQTAIYLGGSLGPMFGGFVSDLFGHRVSFFATSILLFSAGLIVWRFAVDNFEPPAERKSLLKSMVPDFRALSKARAIWALLAVVAADQISGSIASPFLPLFIQSISAAPSAVGSMTGLILGLGALSSALAAVILGKLSYRIGYRRTLVFCMLAAAAFLLPQPFARNPYELLFLRIASCFFIGGNMPSVNALLAEKAQAGKQGSVYGLSSSVASTANAIGPAIGSGIAAMAGYGSVFFATAAILALAGSSIGFFVRKGRAAA
jgi:DHA1 family multidrug resistance protein-like MFS transporter